MGLVVTSKKIHLLGRFSIQRAKQARHEMAVNQAGLLLRVHELARRSQGRQTRMPPEGSG
jgi:hypothetical protein